MSTTGSLARIPSSSSTGKRSVRSLSAGRSSSPDGSANSVNAASTKKSEAHLIEMGFIHLEVKDLQNTSDLLMNFQGKSIIITVDYVTDNYCKIKTLVTKHDANSQQSWGTGFYFRVFTPNKEVSFEIKASSASPPGGDAAIDFGASRLSLVPALDSYEDAMWCVLTDRFGKRNNCRIQVGWKYVAKLNRVRSSILSKAVVQDPSAASHTHHLVFNGSAVGSMERCESLGLMLERVCCGPASLDDDAALAPLLFLSRYFAALRDAAYSKRLARLISEPSRCRSAEEKSYLSDTSYKTHVRREGPAMSSPLFLAVMARRSAVKIQRVVRGHAARSLHRKEVLRIKERHGQSAGKKDQKVQFQQSLPETQNLFHRSVSVLLAQRSSERRLLNRSESGKNQLLRMIQMSESFISKQHMVAKMLKEVDEASVINPMLQAEFDALPAATTVHTGTSFSFRLPPSLGGWDAEDSMLGLARRAVFRFLCEQILGGVGILRSLEPSHETPSAKEVVSLLDIGQLVGYDRGQTIFEQNMDADSFGIVCSGHIRVLYNRREVSTLIAGQSFSDLGMLSLVNIASIFGHAKCVHGASFVAAARSLVLIISYDRFLEHVHGLGPRPEAAVRSFLTQSDNIGRETWSAYGSSAKSIEISFLYFMSTKAGLLGMLNMVEVRALASIATYQKFHAHEYLCRQGDWADGIFIILTGVAAILVDGKQVAFISRGKEVGEMGLIGNFARLRTASMVAHYDCEVAIITYENFMAFIEILSQHQAQRLATYVAESVLPKYLSNLSLRRDSEAEFAAMQRKRATRSRRSSIVPMSMEPGTNIMNGGQATFQSSPVADGYGGSSPMQARSECLSAREATILQNIRLRNSQDFRAGQSPGWHIYKPLPHHGLARFTKTASTTPSSVERQRLDSELHELARANVRSRLREHAQQEYLIPRKPNCKTKSTKSQIGSFPTQSVSKKVELELPINHEIGMDGVKAILGLYFSNIAEVMIAFDSAGDGFLMPQNLIDGLKQLDVPLISVVHALKEVKYVMSDGRIDCLRFMHLFSWGIEKTDEELIELWNHSRCYAQEIQTKFSRIKEDIKYKQTSLPKYHKVLSILSSILDDITKCPNSTFEACTTAEFLKKILKNKNVGLSHEELETAFAIVSEISVGTLTLTQVQSVLKLRELQLQKKSAPAEDLRQYELVKDSLREQSPDCEKTFKSSFISFKKERPQSARGVPKDRLSLTQRPKTARSNPFQPHYCAAK